MDRRVIVNRGLTAAALLLWALALQANLAFAQFGPARVVVAEAIDQEVSSGEQFVGTVRPLKRAVVGSAVDGRVVEFPVNVGDRVEAGATLAQLLTDTITLEKEAADAELALRRQELTELENGSLKEDIEQARARMEAASANKEYFNLRLARVEKLRRENAASEEAYQEALSASLAGSENYLATKAAWELAVRGPREEKIAQARSRVALQEAVVEKLEDQLKKHTVITRFTGYVTAERTEVGEWVSRGAPVAEIVALDTVEIEAFVLDSHVGYIELNEDVVISVPALPGQVFTGRVTAVVPQADERTRTFPVRVQVPNEIGGGGPVLKAGMLAQVTLQTGATQQATLVPKDSLVLGGPAPMVFVVVADPQNAKQQIASPVLVEIGIANGNLIQVLPSPAAKGMLVKPGDRVVVLGNERLRPGQPVELAETPAAAADGNTRP
ncbi:MAG: efflux RND transporter periplasmic adaptor subunit [Planctomycetaceae bacterium]|nr:efflux RND transporter periplasmic adaptor subunit [Planctomycetaceae bacterium]